MQIKLKNTLTLMNYSTAGKIKKNRHLNEQV